MKFSHKANPVSPWHNIPLHAGKGLYNFVAEIPKNSSAKFEVATVRIWSVGDLGGECSIARNGL